MDTSGMSEKCKKGYCDSCHSQLCTCECHFEFDEDPDAGDWPEEDDEP